MIQLTVTQQEFDAILEAIEDWENRDEVSRVMETILTVGKSPVQQAQIEVILKPMKQKRDAEAKIRKERSVLLRAKLIGMRDAPVATNES